MSDHCPQDGGFVGDAGCTHPNHEHSELVKGLLSADSPHDIDVGVCEAALKEGFYVDAGNGKRVGFGKSLLKHIDGQHDEQDAEKRKARMLFAVDAVKRPDATEVNHRGFEDRTMYLKAYDGFGMVVVTQRESDIVEYAFTVIPKRGKKKKGQGRAGSPSICEVQMADRAEFSRIPGRKYTKNVFFLSRRRNAS